MRLFGIEWLPTKYRIVTDKWLGFAAQYRPWWCPFWIQCGHSGGIGFNTSESAFRAKRLIESHKAKRSNPSNVVWQE